MSALTRSIVAIGLGYLLANCSNVTGASGGLAPRVGDVWYVRGSHFFGLPVGSGSVWYCPNPGDHPNRVGCIEALIAEDGEADPGSGGESATAEERGPGEPRSSSGGDETPSYLRRSCGDLQLQATSAAVEVNGGGTIPAGDGTIVADGTYVLARRESAVAGAPHTYRSIIRLQGGSTLFELSTSIDGGPEHRLSGTAAFDRGGRVRLTANCPTSTILEYDRFASSNDRFTLINIAARQAAVFVRWSPDQPRATPAVVVPPVTPQLSPAPTAPTAPPVPPAAVDSPSGERPPRRSRHRS